MIQTYRLAPALLERFAEPSQDASKCLAEMAMARHYLRRLFPAEMIPAEADARLAEALSRRIHSDAYYRLTANEFLLEQCITPYVFLRGDGPRSDYYEALCDAFAATDTSLRETLPYRRAERGFLLAKLGLGPLPDWQGSAVMEDARHLHAFNRDLGYAFTHTVFFATDFGLAPRPDPAIGFAARMLAAQAHAANDVDLFLECCICLVGQELTPDERADLLALIADVQHRNAILFQAADILAEYHPLFVHDILRGLVLRHLGTDILSLGPATPDGPIAGLIPLGRLLLGKDPDAILTARDAYAARWGASEGLDRLVEARLGTLDALARRGALFQREFAVAGAAAPALYAEYLERLTQAGARLGRA